MYPVPFSFSASKDEEKTKEIGWGSELGLRRNNLGDKKRGVTMSSPACDERLIRNLAGLSEEGGTPGLGREPILLIPDEMLEFGLIHFEMRQDLLADGNPLR